MEEKEVTLEDIAKECVAKITWDINLRSGFGAAYRMIDPAMKEDILKGWIYSVKEVLEKHGLKEVAKNIPTPIPTKELPKPATMPSAGQIGVK